MQEDTDIIPPVPLDSLSCFYGSRILRTMTLLETSNEKQRNKVRILFYGQSVVKGSNAESIITTLRQRYPYAIIEYENRAIGGFEAHNLMRTTVHDVYPYYPDLLIFHVWRGTEYGELERIFYDIRKYTTSEILVFNHPYAWNTHPEYLKRRTKEDDIESDHWRYLAQKYGCEFVELRHAWKAYIDRYPGININSLIGDTIRSNVHPNPRGKRLMELLILQHFRFNPYAQYSGWFNQVRTYDIRRFFEEKESDIRVYGTSTGMKEGAIIDSGMVRLDFTGNKIELIAPDSMKGDFTGIDVLIDGEKPSENPDLYYCTLPSTNQWGKVKNSTIRPAIKRITLGEGPVVEDWRLIIKSIDYDEEILEFEVIGEKTGFDGTGDNQAKFISNSGRIIIDPSDFNIFAEDKYRGITTPVGFEVTWEVKPLFSDKIEYNIGESTYLIAQGLKNTSHTLTLIQDGDGDGFPIRSLKVYEPPLKY
jgi:hypothetical protein